MSNLAHTVVDTQLTEAKVPAASIYSLLTRVTMENNRFGSVYCLYRVV